jgi:Flp pilus assembly protein TadD
LLTGQLGCLGLTLARSAWIGFAVTAVILGIGGLILSGKRRLAYLAIGMAGLIIVFALALRPPLSTFEVNDEPPATERTATLIDFDHGSTAARLTVWRFTLPLIAERPWLGYGPETFHEVFVEVFPPQLVYYHGRDVKVDRAHNLWLDLAMSVGVVGTGAFVLILAGFVVVAWRGLRLAGNPRDKPLWIFLVAALGGFLVDQQFSFSQLESSVLLWLLLGLGGALGCGVQTSVPAEPEAAPGSGAKAAGIAVVYAVLISVVCIRPLLADTLAWHARQVETALDERITLARDVVRLESREPAYRAHLSWLYLSMGEFELAEDEILAARRLSPNDPRVQSAVGELYALWGLRDTHKLEYAERAYRRTLELAPHVAIYHTALGLVLAQQGRIAEGIRAVERAVDLDATDGVAYAHLAGLYEAAGRSEDARRAREEAARLGVSRG